jgi:hypothetical protein
LCRGSALHVRRAILQHSLSLVQLSDYFIDVARFQHGLGRAVTSDLKRGRFNESLVVVS